MGSIQPETTAARSLEEVRLEASDSPERDDSTDTSTFAEQSDHDCLLAFQRDQNAAAFTVLVERHRGLAFAVAQRMLGCPHAAEDVAQATFMVLAKNASKIRQRHSLVSWLYGVAYRISARSLRQRAKATVSTLKDEVMVSDDPLEALNARYEQSAVFEELQRLREELRAPMVLRYLKGKSNLEVADELDLSESAIEGRLKRARKQLRLRLARKGVTFAVAIGLLGIVQREATAACLTTSTTSMASASLASQSLAGAFEIGTETGISNEAIHLAEQEIFKMASIKAASFALVASVVLGVVATGWALASDNLTGTSNTQQANNGVLIESSAAEQPAEPTTTTMTLQEDNTKDPFGNGGSSSDTPWAKNSEKPADRVATLGHYSSEELSDGEVKIFQALKMPAKMDYYEVPFRDIVEEIMADYQVQIVLDEDRMQDEGLDPEELITLKLQNVSLDSALKLMLEKHNIIAVVKDEVLFFTSVDYAEQFLINTRVYPIPDHFLIDAGSMMQTIYTNVEAEKWEVNGGPGSISEIEGALVISAEYKIHMAINDLFKQMDKLYSAKK